MSPCARAALQNRARGGRPAPVRTPAAGQRPMPSVTSSQAQPFTPAVGIGPGPNAGFAVSAEHPGQPVWKMYSRS
jgi:hypothetical protein